MPRNTQIQTNVIDAEFFMEQQINEINRLIKNSNVVPAVFPRNLKDAQRIGRQYPLLTDEIITRETVNCILYGTLKSGAYIVDVDMAIRIRDLRNIKNRSSSSTQIDKLSCEIVNDEFVTHSQGISFGRNGAMINGLHRINAIISTGEPQVFWVTFGECEWAYPITDHIKIRTTKDSMEVSFNEDHPAMVGGIIRCLATIDLDFRKNAANYHQVKLQSPRGKHTFSDTMIQKYRRITGSIDPHVEVARNSFELMGSKQGIGAAHYLISKQTTFPHFIDDFFHEFIAKGKRHEDDPEKNYPATNALMRIMSDGRKRYASNRMHKWFAT